jgi:hypothetical protein
MAGEIDIGQRRSAAIRLADVGKFDDRHVDPDKMRAAGCAARRYAMGRLQVLGVLAE